MLAKKKYSSVIVWAFFSILGLILIFFFLPCIKAIILKYPVML